jgi:hypothetical protein
MARARRIIAQAAVDPPAPIAAAPDPAPEEADAPEEPVEQVIETEEDYHPPQRRRRAEEGRLRVRPRPRREAPLEPEARKRLREEEDERLAKMIASAVAITAQTLQTNTNRNKAALLVGGEMGAALGHRTHHLFILAESTSPSRSEVVWYPRVWVGKVKEAGSGALLEWPRLRTERFTKTQYVQRNWPVPKRHSPAGSWPPPGRRGCR